MTKRHKLIKLPIHQNRRVLHIYWASTAYLLEVQPIQNDGTDIRIGEGRYMILGEKFCVSSINDGCLVKIKSVIPIERMKKNVNQGIQDDF